MADPNRKAGRTARIVSAILWLFLTAAYLVRTDGLYAVTIWPAIVWTAVGLLLLLPGCRRNRSRQFWGLFVAWIVFFLGFAEEPLSLVHSLLPNSAKPVLTVVTLNCAGGDPRAAAEVAAYHPDIVFLQESPSAKEVEALAKGLYGKRAQWLHGVDASIIASCNRLEPIPLPKGTGNFVAARLKYDEGELVAVSLRLQPPIFRLDYWSPDCWDAYAENRRKRREEFREIANFLKEEVPGGPVILAGDFNTPPDWRVTAPIAGRLTDAYAESGSLWGYTAVNEFPLARIDQIWVSRNFKPIETTAFKTENSDHRLVRCRLGGHAFAFDD